MDEYIKRGALIKDIESRRLVLKITMITAEEALVLQGNVIRKAIEEAPAADVVEVGRAISAIVNTPSEFSAEQATPDFLNGLAHRQNEIIDVLKMLADEGGVEDDDE